MTTTAQIVPKFEVGERLVALHQSKTAYDAQILAIRKQKGVLNYNVHFIGWNRRHDFFVAVGSEEGVMFKGNLEEYNKSHGLLTEEEKDLEVKTEAVDTKSEIASPAGAEVVETNDEGATTAQVAPKAGKKVQFQAPENPATAQGNAPKAGKKAPKPKEAPKPEEAKPETTEKSTTAQDAPKFEVGERLVALHKKKTPYEAVVMAIKDHKKQLSYRIHFVGWNNRHDIHVAVGSEEGELFKGSLEEYNESHPKEEEEDMVEVKAEPVEKKPEMTSSKHREPKPEIVETNNTNEGSTTAQVAPKAGKKAPKPKEAKTETTEKPATTQIATKFEVGESLIAMNHENQPYEAHIMAIQEHEGTLSYHIHYVGFNRRYDEFVAVGSEEGKLFKGTRAENKKSLPSSSKDPKFRIDEKFVCLFKDKSPHEAQIKDIKEFGGIMHYNIQFCGWDTPHDVYIPVGKEEPEMFKGTLDDYKKSQVLKELRLELGTRLDTLKRAKKEQLDGAPEAKKVRGSGDEN